MTDRIKRINELLKEQISQLLLKEVDFGDILVTITNIETSKDLAHCKVRISILPEQKQEQALKIIQRNIFHIQKLLNKKLYMRIVPKISFEIDKLEARAHRIEELLGKKGA